MDETYGPRRGRDALRPAPARGPVAASPDPDSSVLDRTFERDDISMIRHAVRAGLAAAGFAGDRLQSFVLAVNEIITNAVLHAGGHGRVVLAETNHSMWCTVTDAGPGIPPGYQHAPEIPEAFETGGRGIWLAYRLCDEVTMATGPIGTTVGLRMALPRAGSASGLVNVVSAQG